MTAQRRADFARYAVAAAKLLRGEPNKRLSTKHELKWGTKGSLSVNPVKGQFHDYETDEKGGCLDLIIYLGAAIDRAGAVRWLIAKGLHIDDAEPVRPEQSSGRVRSWIWTDEAGVPLFRTQRFESPGKPGEKNAKQYKQHKADGKGGWESKLNGARNVPLNLPKIIEAAAAGGVVFILEGEPKVDIIESFGGVGTCSRGGAKNWQPEFAQFFAGSNVVILPDNDESGFGYAVEVAQSLEGIAANTLILELPGLPPKGDIVDWVTADPIGNNAARLQEHLSELGRDWKRWAADKGIDAGSTGKAGDWRKGLKLTSKGNPYPNTANICIELENDPAWAGAFYFDEFAHQIMVEKPIPVRTGAPGTLTAPRPFMDSDLTAALRWFQLGDYPLMGVDKVDLAIRNVAKAKHSRHPVLEWFETLQWDGKPRLDGLLETYFGAVPTSDAHAKFIRAIGARWMISGVARIYRPGCQVDHALILESPQGTGKSSAFAVLGDPWFSDALPGDLGSKDAADFVAGCFIIELSELAQFKRASSVESLKSFITRRVERYRPAYGRHKEIYARQCIFGGSTNQSAYLTDSTGNRRFWPVQVGKVDLMALKLDRDQLWAEARHRFLQGEIWWLGADDELISTAAEEQAARFEADPWEGPIAAWLGLREAHPVTISQILKDCLELDLKMQRRGESTRVAETLTRLGWVRGKRWASGTQWVKSTQGRGS